ncbi:MAG: hypothetical protein KAQ92_02730, partial [Candidatus Aenigmarchaeota archaeon]|nr:hypothetical protein [Candidatus Aenigmarchaeota archaeon]
MKISFPHMGNTYIALAGALKVLGADFVVPPYTTKKTLNLGSKNSPEVICLPYKLVLGNYFEAIEAGAEAFLMIDSPGICRLGQYSELARNVIKDTEHNVKFINLDLYKGFFELYYGFIKATGNTNPVDIIRALNLMLIKIEFLDKLDKTLNYYRAREIEKGNAKKAHIKALRILDNALTVDECQKALKTGLALFLEISINRHKAVLHIDLTGEIFVVIDHFSNMDIENELGNMGVHVHKKINLSDWTNTFIKPSLLKFSETHGEKAKRLAKEFLKRDIGGDALE